MCSSEYTETQRNRQANEPDTYPLLNLVTCRSSKHLVSSFSFSSSFCSLALCSFQVLAILWSHTSLLRGSPRHNYGFQRAIAAYHLTRQRVIYRKLPGVHHSIKALQTRLKKLRKAFGDIWIPQQKDRRNVVNTSLID